MNNDEARELFVRTERLQTLVDGHEKELETLRELSQNLNDKLDSLLRLGFTFLGAVALDLLLRGLALTGLGVQ